MRKLLLSLLGVIVSITIANAGKVTEQQALQKAQKFLKGKSLVIDHTKSMARSESSTESNAFFIFNAENKGGFVIVSGDDRTADILGYSDHGELIYEKAPCNVRWLLSCYQHVIDSLALEPNVKAKARTRGGSPSRAAIDPLITTHWGQGAPYNNMCPEVDGQKCLTGCVATAMAQVINYHKWPQGNTSALDAYTTTNNYAIDMPQLSPTSFDWNNMTDDEIARLMLYCGQSVNMNYGINESGAGRPDEAFLNAFGYSKSTTIWGGKKFTAEHWEEHIYNELVSNRPIYYAGSSSSSGGHAFVVDGYKDGLFHINWGWDGDEDGLFLLTGLTEDVMPFPYNSMTEACLGLEPPAHDVNTSTVITKLCHFDTRSLYRANSSEDFFPQAHFSSNLYSDFEGATYIVGYGLYDDKGLVKVLGQEQKTFPLNESYHLYLNIGSDIPQGTYRIMPIFRYSESDSWMLDSGFEQHHIIVHINEKSLTFEDPVDDDNGDYYEYGVFDYEGVTYQCFSEFGNLWAHVLPYHINDKYSGNIVIPNKIEIEGNTFIVARDEYDAFKDCDELLSITTSAENGLIVSKCPKLKSITVKQGTSMEISYCHALENIEFPITMDYPIVHDCNELKTIKILNPALQYNSLVAVRWGDESLPALTDVYFPSSYPPVVHEEGDIPVNSKATIHVPKGSLNYYKNSPWKSWKIVDDQPIAPFVTWGYCHGDAVNSYGMSSGMGDNDAEYAMCVPAEEMKAYIGSQITHIQVYSPSRSINDYGFENYEYVFVTKPGTDYLVKQPFEVIRGAWNTVKLDEPYTITGDSLYVGVGRHGTIGIMFSDDTYVFDASWQRAMGKDDSDPEKRFLPGEWVLPCPKDQAHPLPLRFAIEGEGMPEGVIIRELKTIDPSNSRAMSQTRGGTGMKLQGTIRNRSLETITSYKVEWAIDGSEKNSKTFETSLLPNETEMITIDLPESVMDGHHVITTDVVSMNEITNELAGFNMPSFELGTPDPITVTAKSYSIHYGEELPSFEYTTEGGELTGVPTITCEATKTSPVGSYTITIEKGSVKNKSVTYKNGTLTIKKAPLTIKAGTYSKNQGEANPVFTLTYEGFKNGETKDVLTTLPTVQCTATSDSPAGDYPVTVSGAEAQNYDISYVNGKLTIIGSGGPDDPTPAEETITISGALQVPYYSEYNLDFTDKPELRAYVATGYDKSTGVIWLTRVKQVPAETGFLLMGDPGDYDIPTIDGVSEVYYKNMFKGTLEGTTLYTTDGDYTNYYLSKGDAGVGFYKVTKEEGVKVGANRCYLPILTEIPANGSEGDTEMIKVSAAKQVPYYTSKNLDFSSLDAQGVKAYTATGYNYSTGVIWLTRVKKVPAQTGILVMADVEGDYNVPTTSVQSVYENMFVGSETAQTIYTNEEIDGVDYVNYYLSKGDAGVGFYKVTNEDGVKMGANRCYLPIPKRDAASSARGKNRGTGTFCKMILSDESNDDVIAIPVFGGMNGEDDGTTGIEVQSSIFNLQSDGVYYNLQGQRVEKPRKGIYIHNGRRVVIK